MAPRIIAVIGGLVMDMITITDRLPDSGETLTATSFSTHLGGKGANAAVAAYRLSHRNPGLDSASDSDDGSISLSENEGIQVRMTGAVGDDDVGNQLIAMLESNFVDISGIRRISDQSSGIGIVIVESDFGENRILYHPRANHSLMPNDFLTLENLAQGARPDLLIAQLELPRDTVEQILETASREKVEVLLNPAPAQFLLEHLYSMVTHLVVNETEAATLTGRQAEELEDESSWAIVTDQFLRLGVSNVVITLGAKGAYYSNKIGERGHVAAEMMNNVVDATGAGYKIFFLPVSSFVDQFSRNP